MVASASRAGRNRRIDLHDGEGLDGLGAGAFAAEGEVGDVDAVLAEDGADFADDAGDVEVAADQQVAFQRRLDVDGVELEQARLLAVNDGGAGAADSPSAVCSSTVRTLAAPPRWVSAFCSWMRMPRSCATAAALMRFTFSEPCSRPAMAALRTSSVLASASVPP